ncbi:ABC transporter permease [Dehalococcoidia bacterium]|nr:ABC transporter permease [Dehalococcoidia bacterium]
MNEDRTSKGTSQWGIVFRQLRRNKLAIVGVAIVLSVIFVAIFAPFIAPRSYSEQELRERLLPPSREYPLGTDALGRCLFSRLVYGSRIALWVGVIVVGISASIGVILGLISGYYGGIIDSIIMRLVDVTVAFPLLVLAIAIAGALGPGLTNGMIALGIVAWSTYARLVRGQVLSVKENEYIEATRAVGTGNLSIIFRHILPNVIGPIIVMATLTIPWALLAATALSFLGIGAQPPTPCWGAILSEGRGFLRQSPWIATFPGIAIMITVLGFNFFGDGLRDALDPRLKT